VALQHRMFSYPEYSAIRPASAPDKRGFSPPATPLGENGVFLLARLDRFSNAWGGRRRAVRLTCQLSASFSFSSHSCFPRTGLAKRPSCAKGRTRSKELMGQLSRQD